MYYNRSFFIQKSPIYHLFIDVNKKVAYIFYLETICGCMLRLLAMLFSFV